MGVTLIAFSGGKDSTAMILRLHEVEPETVKAARVISSPTGDELPGVVEHLQRVAAMVDKPIEPCGEHTLDELIEAQRAIPNTRFRWCTKMLKVQPVLRLLRSLDDPEMLVGLRFDEPERRGIYSDDVRMRFPLREWGWTVDDVWGYLRAAGISVPPRTDCARCPFQRLHEWRQLWRDHPAIYAAAEAQEIAYGHTFRSDSRDTWPADLAALRLEFEKGRPMVGDSKRLQLSLFDEDEDDAPRACRVCSL